MLTDEKYQKALEALRSGTMPEHLRSTAADAIAEYERGHGLAQGVSEAGATRAAPATTSQEKPSARAARQRKLDTIEAEHPGLTKAFQMQGPSTLQLESGPTPEEAAADELEQRSQFDDSIQNLSKRKELAAPAEWHPPTPATPPNPFDSVWGKLTAVKQAMPDWAGGGTEHYIEPSVEQFKLEMAPVLGQAVEGMAEGTPAYREWADAKWMDALGKAQAEGRGIVRDAFRPGAKGFLDTAGDLVRPANIQKIGQMGRSAAIGADKIVTGGTVSTMLAAGPSEREREQFREASARYSEAQSPEDVIAAGEDLPSKTFGQQFREGMQARNYLGAAAPVSQDVGAFRGALSPGAIGNLAVSGAGKAVRGAVDLLPGGIMGPQGVAMGLLDAAAGSTAGKLAAGAAGGALGAGATQGAEELPGVLSGDNPGAGERIGLAAAYGAPMGLVGTGLGILARNEGATLRENTPLGVAEQGGARMRPIRGVDPGSVNRGLERRARTESIGEVDKPDVARMLAHDLSEPFGKRAHAMEDAITAKGQPLREFEEAFAHDKIPLKKAIQTVLDAKQKLVLSDGTISNPKQMGKLDELLDQLLKFEAQKPEGALTKNEQLLNQMENAAALHGDLGTNQPEVVARDIRELSTPTRPVTPVNTEGPTRRARDTVVDVGDFGEKLPDFRTALEGGFAGERLRSLHEARGSNPDTFDITPKEAIERGLDVGKSTVKVFDPETRQMVDADVPNFARLSPKARNPDDVKQITAKLFQENETGSVTKEPFPDYEKIKRALHQDRDAFTGETDAIKRSDTFKLENGETVRGYSAANARLENESKEFKNLLELLGFKGQPPDMRSDMAFSQMEGLAANFGKGGRSPEIDRAFREMAAETGMTPTLENLVRYRAMKRLQEASKLREVFRFGGMPSVGMLSGEAARLRLDPIIQGAIPYLENAGSLGAVPGEIEQSRELPGMADQATLDEIRRALQP
jgi:hypothetical protein